MKRASTMMAQRKDVNDSTGTVTGKRVASPATPTQPVPEGWARGQG